jgi:hypothetical protein
LLCSPTYYATCTKKCACVPRLTYREVSGPGMTTRKCGATYKVTRTKRRLRHIHVKISMVQTETTALAQHVAVFTESYIFDYCDYLFGWVKPAIIATVAPHILVSATLLSYIRVCQADPKCSHPTGQYMQSKCSPCHLQNEFDSVHKTIVFKIISRLPLTHRSMRANQP